MISTVVLWVYALFLTFLYGFLSIRVLQKLFGFSEEYIPPFVIVALTGLTALSTIVGYLSIFVSTGLISNVLLLAFAIPWGLCERQRLHRALADYVERIKRTDKYLILVFVLAFFVVLMQSTSVPLVYDTGLYHAQAIKWIEEYKQVPGLANLHSRLGFNSSWLWLSALFSLSFLRSEPFHVLDGWFMLLIIIYALDGVRNLAKGKFQLGSIIRVAVFVIGIPLSWSEISSPYLDMPVMLTVWLLFASFLDETDARDADFNVQHALIVVLSCFVVTLKLSAVPILILSFYILGTAYLKDKRNLFVLTGIAFLIMVPWFIRNIIQTGYLVYPFPAIDIFGFDWKLPAEYVSNEERWIESWARIPGVEPDLVLNLPWQAWIPIWFQWQPVQDKLLSLWILFFSLVNVVRLAINARNLGYVMKHASAIAVWASVCVGVLFWFLTAPGFRFGYGFLVVLAILLAAPLLNPIACILQTQMRFWVLVVMIVELAVLYIKIDYATLDQRAIFSAPYPRVETTIVSLKNFQTHVPIVNDQCWLTPLPCTPYADPKTEMRGRTLEDGFRMSNP